MSFVFISHRSVDKPRLRHFVLRLVDRRIPVWIDNFEEFNATAARDEPRIERAMLAGRIAPATDWPTEIDAALLEAFAIVLFWSAAWGAERSVLSREHGIALARHRTGEAKYFPVFLDPTDALPPALTRYRLDAGDHVQAFDVARYGNDQWTALVDAIEETWQAWQRRAPAAARTAGSRSARTDWAGALASAREFQHSADLLRGLPEGPAVDAFSIPQSVRRAFAAGTNDLTGPAVVAQATQLVLAALGSRPPNAHAYVIAPSDLRPVGRVALVDYWADVFDHACLLGPRMVAALLLAAPPAVLSGIRSQAADLLGYL